MPRKDFGSFRGFFFVHKEEDITEIQENNNNFCSISLSGGKDSSALLLLMIEKDMPIDCVLYADTGMEFPEMEAHISKLDNSLTPLSCVSSWNKSGCPKPTRPTNSRSG